MLDLSEKRGPWLTGGVDGEYISELPVAAWRVFFIAQQCWPFVGLSARVQGREPASDLSSESRRQSPTAAAASRLPPVIRCCVCRPTHFPLPIMFT